MATSVDEREGVVRDANTGEAFLPPTQRPDGTWRKPRRVKEGYVPQEEMPVYENRSVQVMRSRASDLPPGMHPADASQYRDQQQARKQQQLAPEPDPSIASMSKSAKKNAKRKEKKKQKDGSDPLEQVTQSLAASQLYVEERNSKFSSNIAVDGSEERETLKKVRTLRKKLKQILDLEQRIASGELKEPAKEQLDKLAKKQEIQEEIGELEAQMG